MELKHDEYGAGCLPTKEGFAESIIVTKAALEKWRDHYLKNAHEIPEDHPSRQFMVGLYTGKADALIELLKHLEEE